MKMRFLFIILMLQCLKSVDLNELIVVNEENQENVEDTTTISGIEDIEIEVEDNTEELSTEALAKLHDMAKNISHSKGIFRDNANKENADDKPEVRRSILKKIAVETQTDVMNNILNRFKSNENKLYLLEEVEYLVHQYEVAVVFAYRGGIEILTPYLFSTDYAIVSSAASVLGAAMQSNPAVQKIAVKNDVGKNLLSLLYHKSTAVVSKVMFALASYLRNFPEAQDDIFARNGISQLADVLKSQKLPTRIKLKIINLFSDLSVEFELDQHYLYNAEKPSKEIPKLVRLFAREVQHNGICKLVPSLLNLEDFNSHENVVSAMISLKSICLTDFAIEETENRIKNLMNIYNPYDGSVIYPVIDMDHKKALHDGLKTLLEEIGGNSKKSNNKNEL